MEKFISDLTNPYFWLGVVLVGIAINLISALLIKASDAAALHFPRWLRSKTAARKATFERTVTMLVRLPELFPVYAARESRYRISGLLMWLIGIVPLSIRDRIALYPSWLSATVYLLAVLAIAMATLCLRRASSAAEVINEAAFRYRSTK